MENLNFTVMRPMPGAPATPGAPPVAGAPGLGVTAPPSPAADNPQPAANHLMLADAKAEWDHCRMALDRACRQVAAHTRDAIGQVTDRQQALAAAPAPAGQAPLETTGSAGGRPARAFAFDGELAVIRHAANAKLNGAIESGAHLPAPPDLSGFISPRAAGLAAGDAATSFVSNAELWQQVVDSIGLIETQYLKVYETVVERYTNLFRDFSDFMSGLTRHLKVTTDDKGNQTMQFDRAVLDEIQKLIDRYSVGAAGILFPESGGVTKAQAEEWAKELGIDAKCVQPYNGGYVVRMDLSPLEAIKKDLTDSGVKPMNTFQYQSWRSGFDAQADKFKTTLQTLTTKYGNANAMFDTLVKVLSSSITSGADALKQIIASF
ncbi:IpaD/SipD/SspD family type III secretion system needle tip protein [Sodalis sp. RH21]|uniref:IpaD/SipD/SspD family type III secretion system needle tip protein n=1 Tax=unclassified Sodalis (in: enterobacteria) TaxID=2636512 RepID=UPI0039B4D463